VLLERDERIKICSNKIDNLIKRNIFYTLTKKISSNLLFNDNNDNYISLDFDFEFNNMIKELIWNFELFIDNFSIILTKESIINSSLYNNIFNHNTEKISNNHLFLSTIFLIDGLRRDGLDPLDQNTPNIYNSITNQINSYKYNTRYIPNSQFNTYSFGLEPTLFQPNGAFNMSTIKTFTIRVILNKVLLIKYLQTLNILYNLDNIFLKMNITTFEYNFVRYQSGLAGLLFTK
jgi:hypothetical protein